MRTRSPVWPTKFSLLGSLFAAGLSLIGSQAAANPPWWPSFSVKNVEADPNKSYAVTDSNGPWMIMVTTFRGQGAEQQAHQLVVELRKQYKRNAYIHKRSYDYTERGMPGIGIDPEGRPKRMQYANEERGEEVAVLMGDYRSVDDPEGQKDLAMLKGAEPECLKKPGSQPAENSFAALKRKSQELWGGYASKGNGPLAGAIMTTNPLLPKDFFAARQGVDKFVLDLNKGISNSLLDCPGRYSVKIATFTGKVVIDQRKIHELERGKESQDKADDADPLVMATKKAHALTEELRKKGVDAYEFHDRYSSVVAVGSFNMVGTPRPDGKTEINPAIYDIMRRYGSDPNASHSDNGMIGMGQKSVQVTLDGKRKQVLLDVQPVPIEVPRRSISSDFQQTSFFH